jgi:hypothetical protein
MERAGVEIDAGVGRWSDSAGASQAPSSEQSEMIGF